MRKSAMALAALLIIAGCQTTDGQFSAFNAHNLSAVMTSVCVSNMGNAAEMEKDARQWISGVPQIEKFLLLGQVEEYKKYDIVSDQGRYGVLNVYGDGDGCGVSFPRQEETKVLILANLGSEMFPKYTDWGVWTGVIERRKLMVTVSDEKSQGGEMSSVMLYNQDFLNKLVLPGTNPDNPRFIPR